MIKKILLGLLSLVVIAAGALFILWPEDFSINGPILSTILGRDPQTPDATTRAGRFRLPAGYRLGVYADGIKSPRMMHVLENGDMLVSAMRDDAVLLLTADKNGDGQADDTLRLLENLAVPQGITFRDGWLYVGETHGVSRARYDPLTRQVTGPLTLIASLPPGGNHRTRSLGFGPDGWLYVTIGSSCNVCEEADERRAAMMRMGADGSDLRIYATGLRNSVGFDWDPVTGALYAADNGRDMLGENFPPGEVNRIIDGGFYGWPYANGAKTPDPDFGAGNEDRIAASLAPAVELPAHVAPLDLRFLRPGRPGFEHAALVALHGSWNRRELSGYKVISLHFAEDGNIEQRDFLTGFERDEDVIGRPAGIIEGPDGSIYVADDFAGVIYRVSAADAVASPRAAATITQQEDPLAGIAEAERAALAADGARLFAVQSCGQCHDPVAAAGDVAVKVLAGLGKRYTVDDLMALLIAPPSPMPAPDLDDAERQALAVYLLMREDDG